MHPSGRAPLALVADCGRCAGLCCVLPGFVASADFGLTKPPGTACPNLETDFRCRIHASLRDRGFAGCTVYDCFGAGQHLVAATGGPGPWVDDPARAGTLATRFPALRQLHELLWYLDRAISYVGAGPLHDGLVEAATATEALARTAAEDGGVDDVEEHRAGVNVLLVKASETLRRPYGRKARDLRGADLVGADLTSSELRGANLRGALLVGSRLDRAVLAGADLTGADLRGATLHGADLREAFFVHPWQLTSAAGDQRTQLPPGLERPGHWT